MLLKYEDDTKVCAEANMHDVRNKILRVRALALKYMATSSPIASSNMKRLHKAHLSQQHSEVAHTAAAQTRLY